MSPTSSISANGIEINVVADGDLGTFLCLTDMARYKNPDEPKAVVANWMRLRNTIEFLGLWEQLHNPNFKGLEFDAFKNESGGNAFTLSPQKWVETTGAIGIISKSGRYGGGTYAHSDIAFEFASWISPEFKLYLIKDYQRLKKDEAERKSIGWDEKRALSKLNYHIHTDAIQQHLIEEEYTPQEKSFIFANEADMLNVALFGKKAWEWRNEHPDEAKRGENIRDYAAAEELVVLINMESQNAELIKQGIDKEERFKRLQAMARDQMRVLINNRAKEKLIGVNPRLLKGGENNVD